MTQGLRRYEFSERLAEILGASRRDLRLRVTLMITGGLVPPGPRGPGSPPATPEYAADLLIGVMAAPQQAQTVDAIRCYRELLPTAVATDATAPGIVFGPPAKSRNQEPPDVPLVPGRLRFGEALARLLEQARGWETRGGLARELFGIWVSRGFPVAAVQLAAWSEGRRAVVSQRYELPEGGRPPSWLDPDRGGSADPGLFHSVFLPVNKLIEIGTLTSPDERTPRVLGQTITNLANLARNRSNRRPWEKFLSAAGPAQASAEKIDARESRLREVTGFGSNPGNLRMLTYVPDDLPAPAALVVVLHGCTQTAASYDYGTGWSTLADRHGFALMLPEQKRSNNPLRCFNWFKAEDIERDSGETLSIRQMIDRMIADHRIDGHRVYVTGLSAGGAMTSVMLATYPDVFAGGAIIAGVPYRCARGLQEGFDVIFQGRSRSAQEWGDLVRNASSHQGPWPRISVWHGDADSTVKPMNAGEIVKQWTDVHGLSSLPGIEDTIDGHPHRVWPAASGEPLVESYTIRGMAHGAAVNPGGEDGCGAAAAFILDVGISSTHHIARSWGLTETRREVPIRVRRPAPSRRVPQRVPDPSLSESVSKPASAPREGAHELIVADVGGAAQGAGEAPPAQPAATSATTQPQSGGSATTQPQSGGTGRGIDLQAVLSKSLEAARALKNLRDLAADARAGGGAMRGIDIQAILTKSFEAAGLLKSPRAVPPQMPAEAGPPLGLDLQAILATSFEAAGLLRRHREAPPQAPADSHGFAASGWEGEGWQLVSGERRAPGDGAVLFGYASSGIGCNVGNKVRRASRQLSLGTNPRLSYVRKLHLEAAVNILTTASFSVLVDGIPVDEVSVRGMEFTEADWTERADIDLARFAGRTVTLTFEVAANSNVCMEVFAKAWVGGIAVQDRATSGRP